MVSSLTPHQEPNETLRFLVVDDDEESCSMILEYLQSGGFTQVAVAHHGLEALRILDEDPSINFIISDWEMPKINGLHLLQGVKLNLERQHIPFLVITSPSSGEAEKVMQAAENLVDGYLIKPFRSQVLLDKVQKMRVLVNGGHPLRILVVDDDSDARAMIVEYLRELGVIEIQKFSEATAALDYVQKHPKDVSLIISDWEMPGMSGLEFLRFCKNDPTLAQIPFLMVTTQSSIENLKISQAARASVDHYLLKPFDSQDFRKKLATILEQSRAAISHPRKTERQDGAHLKAVLKLANVYEQLGESERALALLQSTCRNLKTVPEAHFELGLLYYGSGQFDLCKIEFEKTLDLDVDHAKARLMLEVLNLQRGE